MAPVWTVKAKRKAEQDRMRGGAFLRRQVASSWTLKKWRRARRRALPSGDSKHSTSKGPEAEVCWVGWGGVGSSRPQGETNRAGARGLAGRTLDAGSPQNSIKAHTSYQERQIREPSTFPEVILYIPFKTKETGAIAELNQLVPTSSAASNNVL